MRFRKLRIAWSVGWGIACVLLLVLWVRSYWVWDFASFRFATTNGVRLSSLSGIMFIFNERTAHYERFAKPITRPLKSEWSNITTDKLLFGFGVLQLSAKTIIFFPHWFVTILSAALAAAPWLRWRFSVRTLLIATTLIAVVLGTIVFLSR